MRFAPLFLLVVLLQPGEWTQTREVSAPEAHQAVAADEQLKIPFTGQGIAVDQVTKGLVVIDRKRKRVILANPPAP